MNLELFCIIGMVLSIPGFFASVCLLSLTKISHKTVDTIAIIDVLIGFICFILYGIVTCK